MNNDKYVCRLLSLLIGITNLDNKDISYYDMVFSEKLMGYSVSLVMEIDDLLSDGYSKKEIIEIINNCDFRLNDPELTEEEALFLRKDALRILNIRYNLYVEDEKDKTLKKHLF